MLEPDDQLTTLLELAERDETVLRVKGHFNGLPFFLVVAVGANAGLVERAVLNGDGLTLNPRAEYQWPPDGGSD